MLSFTTTVDIAVSGGAELTRRLFEEPPAGAADETEIPTQVIHFEPDRLGPDQREFRILVDAHELVSGVYRGTVLVGVDEVEFEFPV